MRKEDKMYSYKKGKSKLKKAISLILLILSVSIFSIIIYSMYQGIDINSVSLGTSEVKAERMELMVDEVKESNETISNMIENTQKTIVGISKIKNNGSSIFLKDGTAQLGIGTGVIIADNGYILTNWHVAGDKYSNCYITTENGKTYNGTVMWADSNIDLAIVKIAAKGLSYIKLGDSDIAKAGEMVYAIGNPIGYEFQRTVTSRNY